MTHTTTTVDFSLYFAYLNKSTKIPVVREKTWLKM